MAIFHIIGDAHQTNTSPLLSGALDISLIGDLSIDFTQTPLVAGQHIVRILTLIGDITLLFPDTIAVSVESFAVIGDTCIPSRPPQLSSDAAAEGQHVHQRGQAVEVTVQVFRLIGDVQVEYMPTNTPLVPSTPQPLLEDQAAPTTSGIPAVPEHRQW